MIVGVVVGVIIRAVFRMASGGPEKVGQARRDSRDTITNSEEDRTV